MDVVLGYIFSYFLRNFNIKFSDELLLKIEIFYYVNKF